MSTEDALGAEEVASKEFPVTFRGFGQHEVRAFLAQVAAELAAARERERLQRGRLEEAEARAAAHTPTEQEIEAALGQEAGRVLHAARAGAAEILAKAEEQAARLLGEATGEGTRAQEEAESILARRTEEAERQATAILTEAEGEAEAQVEKAKAEGRKMIAEAQAVRERILRDLVRRRRIAHQQLEQLRAGRERLLEAYRLVRSTLDEATRELSVAEVEARAAAATAALRAGARPEPTVEEIESELSAARDAGLTVSPSGAGADHGAELNGNGNGHSAGAGGVRAPFLEVPEETDRSDDQSPAEPVVGTEPETVPPEEVAAVLADIVEPVPELAEPVVAPVADGAELLAGVDESVPEVAEPVPEVAEPVADIDEPLAEAVEPVPEVAEAVADLPEAEPVVDAADPDPVSELPEPEPVPEAPESDVERLFARIRADREAAMARVEAVLSEPTGGPAEAAAAPEAEVADGGQSAGVAPDAEPANGHQPTDASPPASPDDDDERVLQERDAQIEPLERVLLRSLKRALADEQNEVLDTLRRHKGSSTLADLLPSADDHVARYVAVAVADVEAAAVQGSRGAGGGEAPAVDDLATAMAAEVADDLRSRLQRALEGADGDEDTVRAVISSAYREWKTSWAQPLVRHHLAAAHARGRFAAVPEVSLRWVVDDDEGACPDCDDNALAGPTPKGQPFPTGQEYPPAHVGCRCMVVPTPA